MTLGRPPAGWAALPSHMGTHNVLIHDGVGSAGLLVGSGGMGVHVCVCAGRYIHQGRARLDPLSP